MKLRRSGFVRALWSCLAVAIALALSTPTAMAQGASGADLVAMLRKGGYVVVLRHASSPPTLPNSDADPENPSHERQLDAAGRKSAVQMGEALKDLHVPIGDVWASPASPCPADNTLRCAASTASRLAARRR